MISNDCTMKIFSGDGYAAILVSFGLELGGDLSDCCSPNRFWLGPNTRRLAAVCVPEIVHGVNSGTFACVLAWREKLGRVCDTCRGLFAFKYTPEGSGVAIGLQKYGQCHTQPMKINIVISMNQRMLQAAAPKTRVLKPYFSVATTRKEWRPHCLGDSDSPAMSVRHFFCLFGE